MTNTTHTFGGDRQLRTIPLDQIDVGSRMRVIADDYVRMLAESIRQIGQTTPIEVRPVGGRYWLVTGGHRFAAIALLGHEAIEAFVIEMDDLQARLREIDENLYRHELNPLDRGRFLAERKAVWEALHPETRHGGNRGNQHTGGRRRQADTMSSWQNSTSDIVSFAEKTALAAGYSARTVQRAIAMYERLAPAVREQLGGSPIARDQSQLIALSKLSHAEQAKVARILLSKDVDRPRTVKAAVAVLQGKRATAPSAADALYQRLLSTWGRAGKPTKRQFLQGLHDSGELDELLAGLSAVNSETGEA